MKLFKNRTVIGVLCILLSLVICFGVTPLFTRSTSEKTTSVRVSADIHEGDEITQDMIQTVEVGAYNLPKGIMKEKGDVVGKYATAELASGDYILASKLSSEPAAENAYLYRLDGTKQAISVTIKSFATGLSGKLKSGDIVSVIVADFNGRGETVIPPELQYVEVISVTASSGYYDMEKQCVCEELLVVHDREEGTIEHKYRLGDEVRKAMILQMDAYCKQRMGITLDEARTEYLSEQEPPQTEPVM